MSAVKCMADLPSAFSMTLGLPDSMTATQELVVPRSIPTMLHKEIKHFLSASRTQSNEKEQNTSSHLQPIWGYIALTGCILSTMQVQCEYLPEGATGGREQAALDTRP